MIRHLKDKWNSSHLFAFTTPPAETLVHWQYVLLAGITFFTCYYGLAAYPILDMNEGLYAEVAREMLVNHHWIIPYLNNVPYLEKPPLLYWLIAFSYHLFGINAFAARLIPATATALTALSLYGLGYQLKTPRTGWIAAIILLTSLVFIIIGRTVFFDMLLTFCFSATLISFYLWYKTLRLSYLYVSYGLLALALLTKGLMAVVMTLPIILIFLWLMKAERSIYRLLLNRKAIILFLILVLPWHMAAMFSLWSFTQEYFLNNQLYRYFNARLPHDYHTGPLYYYLPRLVAYLLPWSMGLLWLLPRRWIGTRPYPPLTAFLWTWVLFLLVFFSLSGDKGDYYLIVATPALAYLLAQKIDQWFSEEKAKWLSSIFAIFVSVLLAAGIVALLFYQAPLNATEMVNNKIPAFLSGSLATLCLFIAVYGAGGAYLCYKNQHKPLLPFLLLIGCIVPSLLFYLTIKEKTQVLYSQKNLASYVHAQYAYRPTYLYQNFATFSSFVFYNGESSKIIDNKSADLQFGTTTDAGEKQSITLAKFMLLAKQNSVYVVMLSNKFPSFQKAAGNGNNFCVIQSNGKVSLISNAREDCQVNLASLQGEQKTLNLTALRKK